VWEGAGVLPVCPCRAVSSGTCPMPEIQNGSFIAWCLSNVCVYYLSDMGRNKYDNATLVQRNERSAVSLSRVIVYDGRKIYTRCGCL
jgi:hypothetical protein